MGSNRSCRAGHFSGRRLLLIRLFQLATICWGWPSAGHFSDAAAGGLLKQPDKQEAPSHQLDGKLRAVAMNLRLTSCRTVRACSPWALFVRGEVIACFLRQRSEIFERIATARPAQPL
jgi:hypothetical protein